MSVTPHDWRKRSAGGGSYRYPGQLALPRFPEPTINLAAGNAMPVGNACNRSGGRQRFLHDPRLRLRRPLPPPLHDLNDIELVFVHYHPYAHE
jgi:hypothetical protein